MSSSRRRRPYSPSLAPPAAPAAARPAEQQVAAVADVDEIVSRLRALLPLDQQAAAAANNGKAKASSRALVLREACVYIRRLHAELDGLAVRLARLLADDDDPSVAAVLADAGDDDELIRNLLT